MCSASIVHIRHASPLCAHTVRRLSEIHETRKKKYINMMLTSYWSSLSLGNGRTFFVRVSERRLGGRFPAHLRGLSISMSRAPISSNSNGATNARRGVSRAVLIPSELGGRDNRLWGHAHPILDNPALCLHPTITTNRGKCALERDRRREGCIRIVLMM